MGQYLGHRHHSADGLQFVADQITIYGGHTQSGDPVLLGRYVEN